MYLPQAFWMQFMMGSCPVSQGNQNSSNSGPGRIPVADVSDVSIFGIKARCVLFCIARLNYGSMLIFVVDINMFAAEMLLTSHTVFSICIYTYMYIVLYIYHDY